MNFSPVTIGNSVTNCMPGQCQFKCKDDPVTDCIVSARGGNQYSNSTDGSVVVYRVNLVPIILYVLLGIAGLGAVYFVVTKYFFPQKPAVGMATVGGHNPYGTNNA